MLCDPSVVDDRELDVVFLFPAVGNGDVYLADPVLSAARSACVKSSVSTLGAKCKWTHETGRSDDKLRIRLDRIGPHVDLLGTSKSGGTLSDSMCYSIVQYNIIKLLEEDDESVILF